MPRANRYFLPGYVWHITHRCHQKEFLLKFSHDRKRWLHWLFEARKRFKLCVLNYIVTSNHIHLLVLDRGEDEIAKSMQLIAGRTAQEYNQRKNRLGAYWQDRYHATAVDTGEYLMRCMAYIDLNMVRAGVIPHPREWKHSGYYEIQNPPMRYRIIDLKVLMKLLAIHDIHQLQREHTGWIEESLKAEASRRDERWTNSLAIGTQEFVMNIQEGLGIKARHREIQQQGNAHLLKETAIPYITNFESKNDFLRLENTVLIDEYV